MPCLWGNQARMGYRLFCPLFGQSVSPALKTHEIQGSQGYNVAYKRMYIQVRHLSLKDDLTMYSTF
jgi:hypothetical protein